MCRGVEGHKCEYRHCAGAVCHAAWIIGVGTTAKLVIETSATQWGA